jgi:hypothetical protein
MKKNTKTGLTGALCIVLLGAALLVTAGCGNKGSQTRHVIAILPVTNPPDENVGIQLRTVVISALLNTNRKNIFLSLIPPLSTGSLSSTGLRLPTGQTPKR